MSMQGLSMIVFACTGTACCTSANCLTPLANEPLYIISFSLMSRISKLAHHALHHSDNWQRRLC